MKRRGFLQSLLGIGGAAITAPAFAGQKTVITTKEQINKAVPLYADPNDNEEDDMGCLYTTCSAVYFDGDGFPSTKR